MEEVDGVGIAADIKVVEVAECFRCRRPSAGEFAVVPHRAHEAGTHGCGRGGRADGTRALEDRFENLEDGCDTFAFLVEDQFAVFHAAVGEEADVAGAGEFLGCSVRGGGVVCRGGVVGGGRVEDGVEVVGDQLFLGQEEEEGEFFQDGDLGDPRRGDGLFHSVSLDKHEREKGRGKVGLTLDHPRGLLLSVR